MGAHAPPKFSVAHGAPVRHRIFSSNDWGGAHKNSMAHRDPCANLFFVAHVLSMHHRIWPTYKGFPSSDDPYLLYHVMHMQVFQLFHFVVETFCQGTVDMITL